MTVLHILLHIATPGLQNKSLDPLRTKEGWNMHSEITRLLASPVGPGDHSRPLEECSWSLTW